MKIFSGVRPTGGIHIGNYLGAIQNWVKLQDKNDCVFCVVDWHAITTPYEPGELDSNIYETALAYLVAGIDPKKSIFFLQSHIQDHLELAWIFSSITPIGELSRMTQYKEKSETDKSPKVGLLNYPVLMAADILLYQAEAVPVGEDQTQHVELTRDVARRFNNQFGETFKEPEVVVPELTARIMSLSDPHKKMSKTGDPRGCIGLFDTEEGIRSKVMSAITDTGSKIVFNPTDKAGMSNLVSIYSAFSDEDVSSIEKRFSGKSYKEFKEDLADLLIRSLKPFRDAQKSISNKEIDKVLRKGAEKAQKKADETMKTVRNKTGFTV